MRVLEQHEQTAFWDITVEQVLTTKKQKRYKLNFHLNRKTVIAHNQIGHFYLLQTDLDTEQISDKQVVENYKGLMKVERSFRDIKSYRLE